jgi:hypothetical protein
MALGYPQRYYVVIIMVVENLRVLVYSFRKHIR